MAKNPVFPVYYNDILGSTQDWTDEEFGAYMRLLIYQWDKGFIPIEPKRLNKIADTSSQHWELLKSKFPPGEDGKLRNIRCEEIRQDKEKHKQRQSDNIKKRYQTSTKLSTNTITKNLPLEEEIEREEEIENKEKGGAEGKGVDTSELIVPQFQAAWKKKFPLYADDRGMDYPALQETASFLCEYLKLQKDFSNRAIRATLCGFWDKMIEHIAGNSHFSGYSLHQVNRYRQSIIANMNKPLQPEKTGLQYLYERYCEEGKIDSRLILADHFTELKEKKLVSISHSYLDSVRQKRIAGLNGTNQATELRLLEAYNSNKPSDEQKQLMADDEAVILLHAQRSCVVSYFKKQKSAKSKNIFGDK